VATVTMAPAAVEMLLLGVHSSAALVAASALDLAALFRSADRRAISCCFACCFSSSSSLESSSEDDDDEEEEDDDDEEDDEAEETEDTSTSLTSEPSSDGVTEAVRLFFFLEST
jgi:hypothetical protein